MPRGVESTDDQLAERELPAVLEWLVVVFGRGIRVHVDDGPGGRRQAPVPRDVIRVVVRLEDVLDPHSEVADGTEVFVDVEARIDDGGHARVLVADQVARTAEVVVNELPEDHRPTLRPVGRGVNYERDSA